MQRNKVRFFLLIIIIIAAFLRLYKLSEVPPSLFGDELDVGYHAYSILKTGRDYSGNFMPLHFQSLAEWRTPLYLYASVPTIALFGISPLGVRLPAALFGILGVWGMYLLVRKLLSYEFRVDSQKKNDTKTVARNVLTKEQIDRCGLISSFILAISPWHIQYSRAGFEVTMLLVFLLFGLYFFFKALYNGKWLWLSMLLLISSPLIYSTAKMFVPFLLIVLILLYKKVLFALPKKLFIYAVITAMIAGIPTAYATLFGGGGQRFNYISVFSDPTIEPEVGTSRIMDALARGELVLGLKPSFTDRLFHNKAVFWTDRITNNYIQAFSTDFLFIKGDPNLRHSINGMGQFYKIELASLILGIILFFAFHSNTKMKILLIFWILFGVLPSAITRDGGNHATRLILILPPLILLMTYGLLKIFKVVPKKTAFIFIGLYIALLSVEFIYYQHNYWVHNPYDSERWWHYGYEESVKTLKEIDSNYDKVILTMSGEPVWIFFAGWYEYPPDKWHEGYPFKKQLVNGFGEVSYIDKYYFGTFTDATGGIYALPQYIDSRTLYLASSKEIGANLIQEPERVPAGIRLIKAIAYPSGEPAFYLFTKL